MNSSCDYCNSCNYCDYCYSCNSCNYCDYCDYCDCCYSCDSCDYCDCCYSCDSCNSCNYCNYCNYCNSCNYCNYCDYCKNLKMTENNYFCWSEEYNNDSSFQQNRYRVFNVEVSKDEYEKIKKIKNKLEFDTSIEYDKRFEAAFKKVRLSLSDEQRQEYFDIPHFNREGFTFITGIKKEEKPKYTLEQLREKIGEDFEIVE